jgi:hypothetical protein
MEFSGVEEEVRMQLCLQRLQAVGAPFALTCLVAQVEVDHLRHRCDGREEPEIAERDCRWRNT